MLDKHSDGLRRYGWSDRVEALLVPVLDTDPTLCPARVVAVERGAARVHDETLLADRAGVLAVGDWVALGRPRGQPGVVETAPRWSTLERLDPDGNRQVMAANVDLVLVTAPADRLSVARVERELVVAWESGARPVVLLTKLDLAPAGTVEDLSERLPAELLATSSVDGRGLDELRRLLGHPTTAVLLGPSGAGKSSLVNALLGHQLLPVNAVREGDHRGRHTTTSRRLVPLPTGGSLVDMPGVRTLRSDAGEGAVAAAFPDIDEIAAECRFADCSHRIEPGCAVVTAADCGHLDPLRLASYRKLERELAHERRRVDRLAREADVRVWKAISKANRRRPAR